MGLFKIDYHIYEDETLNIVIGIQMWPGNHDKVIALILSQLAQTLCCFPRVSVDAMFHQQSPVCYPL